MDTALLRFPFQFTYKVSASGASYPLPASLNGAAEASAAGVLVDTLQQESGGLWLYIYLM